MGCALKQGGGLYERLALGAVLLAAGEGRRMGGVIKPLIRLQGVPLIRRALVALSGAGIDEVAVVTGYRHEAVAEAIMEFPVTVVYNADYAAGQQGSVRRGLEALSPTLDGVMIVLADQPLIGADDLKELIAAFKKRPAGHIVVPMVEGQRGNPILLDGFAREEILRSELNLGCRHLIERHPELVHLHQTANRRFVTDLDAPEDVEALSRRTGWRFTLPPVDEQAVALS